MCVYPLAVVLALLSGATDGWIGQRGVGGRFPIQTGTLAACIHAGVVTLMASVGKSVTKNSQRSTGVVVVAAVIVAAAAWNILFDTSLVQAQHLLARPLIK